MLVGLEQDEAEKAVVGCAVGVDHGVGGFGAVVGREPVHAEELARDDQRRQLPHGGGQQRHVDDGGLAGGGPLVEGGGDCPGGGHAPHDVAESGGGLAHGPAIGAGRQGGAHAAPGPEGGTVVAALLSVGAVGALARAPGNDDLGVALPQIVGVDAELAAHRGHVVGEEHIGGLHQLHQHLPAIGVGQVQADGALAPVGLLDHKVDAAGAAGDQAGGDETPLGVAGDRVLHLDDVGPPIDQH